MATPNNTTVMNTGGFTRQQWASDYLKALGNSNPSPGVVNWVVGWTDYETSGPPGAYYNLLNTTQPGFGGYEGSNIGGAALQAGVKDYPDYTSGINANATVTENGYYPQLLSDLRNNNLNDLIGSSLVTNELGTWGTGVSGEQINQLSGVNASQVFNGEFSSGTTNISSGSGTTPLTSNSTTNTASNGTTCQGGISTNGQVDCSSWYCNIPALGGAICPCCVGQSIAGGGTIGQPSSTDNTVSGVISWLSQSSIVVFGGLIVLIALFLVFKGKEQ